MADINTNTFWNELEQEMWDEVALLVISILMSGVEGGVSALPDRAQPFIDFENLNSSVLEFARKYRFEWIKDITDVTRTKTIEAITNWMRSGSPLEVLVEALTPLFGESRAERIAITEVTRLFAKGNQMAWEATGIVNSVKWMTVRDDRVCEICEPLDGTIIGIGDIDAMPPAHVRCRCYTQPVLDDKAFEDKLDEILGL